MDDKVKVFSTYDVDLAAYLMVEGLKYIDCVLDETHTQGKPRVIMRFFDEKDIARDLERSFMGSRDKHYRDFHRYLLKDIHRTLKFEKGKK
ncbi:MAG: hypothetical protein DRN81_02370 [Thermoproteota archaeon]|nr:MAG: hypothetical protein DRN81_02370 [Candidatus Korarchaeota archaeon]